VCSSAYPVTNLAKLVFLVVFKSNYSADLRWELELPYPGTYLAKLVFLVVFKSYCGVDLSYLGTYRTKLSGAVPSA